MPEEKDYTQMPLEALQTEEIKLKRRKIIDSVLIGFLIGIIIYGVANSGFGFVYIFFPVVLIIAVYRNSRNTAERLEQVQAEISNKKQ